MLVEAVSDKRVRPRALNCRMKFCHGSVAAHKPMEIIEKVQAVSRLPSFKKMAEKYRICLYIWRAMRIVKAITVLSKAKRYEVLV